MAYNAALTVDGPVWDAIVFSLDALTLHPLSTISFKPDEHAEHIYHCLIELNPPLSVEPALVLERMPLVLYLMGEVCREGVSVRCGRYSSPWAEQEPSATTTTRFNFWLKKRNNFPAIAEWHRSINILRRISNRAGRPLDMSRLLSDDQAASEPPMVRFHGSSHGRGFPFADATGRERRILDAEDIPYNTPVCIAFHLEYREPIYYGFTQNVLGIDLDSLFTPHVEAKVISIQEV